MTCSIPQTSSISNSGETAGRDPRHHPPIRQRPHRPDGRRRSTREQIPARAFGLRWARRICTASPSPKKMAAPWSRLSRNTAVAMMEEVSRASASVGPQPWRALEPCINQLRRWATPEQTEISAGSLISGEDVGSLAAMSESGRRFRCRLGTKLRAGRRDAVATCSTARKFWITNAPGSQHARRHAKTGNQALAPAALPRSSSGAA